MKLEQRPDEFIIMVSIDSGPYEILKDKLTSTNHTIESLDYGVNYTFIIHGKFSIN